MKKKKKKALHVIPAIPGPTSKRGGGAVGKGAVVGNVCCITNAYICESKEILDYKSHVMPYANSKGADRPSRSLISAFVIRCLDSELSVVSISKFSSL